MHCLQGEPVQDKCLGQACVSLVEPLMQRAHSQVVASKQETKQHQEPDLVLPTNWTDKKLCDEVTHFIFPR